MLCSHRSSPTTNCGLSRVDCATKHDEYEQIRLSSELNGTIDVQHLAGEMGNRIMLYQSLYPYGYLAIMITAFCFRSAGHVHFSWSGPCRSSYCPSGSMSSRPWKTPVLINVCLDGVHPHAYKGIRYTPFAYQLFLLVVPSSIDHQQISFIRGFLRIFCKCEQHGICAFSYNLSFRWMSPCRLGKNDERLHDHILTKLVRKRWKKSIRDLSQLSMCFLCYWCIFIFRLGKLVSGWTDLPYEVLIE